MSPDQATAPIPDIILEAADDVIGLANNYDGGRFALALAGSISKGLADSLSDVDFRCYSDRPRPDQGSAWDSAWTSLKDRWSNRGLVLDDLWWRTTSEVDATLDAWLAGSGAPDQLVWTIWGYHPLTDLARQVPVIDPHTLVDRWRVRLHPYPEQLRPILIREHLTILRYWRSDYHYRNKVLRQDVVFLSGLASLLVHHLVQTLAALNRTFYPGDGNNLAVADTFSLVPTNFSDRAADALYPPFGAAECEAQRATLVRLIDEVEALVSATTRNEEMRND